MTQDGDPVLAKTLPRYPAVVSDTAPGLTILQMLPIGDRLLLMGYAAGVVALDPPFTVGLKPLDSGAAEPKGFLAIYDASGALQWVHTLGGVGAHLPAAVGRDSGQGAILGGQFKGAISLGATTYTSSTSQYDSFVARLAPE